MTIVSTSEQTVELSLHPNMRHIRGILGKIGSNTGDFIMYEV